jgi:hypothetical protein
MNPHHQFVRHSAPMPGTAASLATAADLSSTLNRLVRLNVNFPAVNLPVAGHFAFSCRWPAIAGVFYDDMHSVGDFVHGQRISLAAPRRCHESLDVLVPADNVNFFVESSRTMFFYADALMPTQSPPVTFSSCETTAILLRNRLRGRSLDLHVPSAILKLHNRNSRLTNRIAADSTICGPAWLFWTLMMRERHDRHLEFLGRHALGGGMMPSAGRGQ